MPGRVIVKPDFAKYVAAARQMRSMKQALTPLVQPMSIDEAALDLSGTEALHGAPPAVVLAGFARDVERRIGVTVSIGLSRNRLLAKLAAGATSHVALPCSVRRRHRVLAPESVGILPGVGPAMEKRLAALGYTRVGQLQALDDRQARRVLGDEGLSLVHRARGRGCAFRRSCACGEIDQRGNPRSTAILPSPPHWNGIYGVCRSGSPHV